MKRLIKEIFQKYHCKLQESTYHCLEEITPKLQGLIDDETLAKNPSMCDNYFNEVMESFKKIFQSSVSDDDYYGNYCHGHSSWKKLENHCQKFFTVLEDISGPPKMASDAMSMELQSTVKQTLGLDFNVAPDQ